ncbi:MAG: hypothetical protein ACLFTW_04980 [Chitinispirillaceae bacterium]
MITAGLSWYSHQGANNPFSLKNELVISGRDSAYFIRYTRGNRKRRLTTLILPRPPLYSSESPNKALKEKWDLITWGSTSPNPDFFTKPPQSWTILNEKSTADSTKRIKNWPSPVYDDQASSQRQVIAQLISPFLDERTALMLNLGTQKVMICDSSSLNNTENAYTPFLEELDLLIIPSAPSEKIREIRSLFRPRFVVVIPPCTLTTSSENILCTNEANWSHEFRISATKGLQPEK